MERQRRNSMKKIMLPFVLGTALWLSSTAYIVSDLFNSQKNSVTVKKYNHAQESLSRLRSMKKDIAGKLDLPYETPKVREVLDKAYETKRGKISQLDEAITDIEQNISEIEKSSDVQNYKKREYNKILALIIGMGGVSIGSTTSLLIAYSQHRRKGS